MKTRDTRKFEGSEGWQVGRFVIQRIIEEGSYRDDYVRRGHIERGHEEEERKKCSTKYK